MLEKTYTRQAHITNFMQGINALPQIAQIRPSVKNVKKREALLLKGQSDDLNVSMGSNHSIIYAKAYESVTGKLSPPTSRAQSGTMLQKEKLPKSPQNLKLQFKMPIAQNLIVQAATSHSRSRSPSNEVISQVPPESSFGLHT